MPRLGRFSLPLVTVAVLLAVRAAWGAGRVQLELVAEPQGNVLAQQEWARRLGQAGVTDFRIRAQTAGDQIGIETRGTQAAPLYAVTGMLTSGGEIVVPGGRFRPEQLGQFLQWLQELAAHGPAEQRPATVAFGLTAEQLDFARKELSQQVGFATAGLGRGEVVRRIAGQLPSPLKIEPSQLQAMDAEKMGEDLSGLACGTSLAYIARCAGLALVPRTSAGGTEYEMVAASAGTEAWPIGWKPEMPVPKLLPAMYEFRNVNIVGVPISQVLSAISQRMKITVLMDHNALTRWGIEPEKAIVKLPVGKSTYALVMQRALFQAKLKYEVRQDEAGTPFFWVTSVKPL